MWNKIIILQFKKKEIFQFEIMFNLLNLIYEENVSILFKQIYIFVLHQTIINKKMLSNDIILYNYNIIFSDHRIGKKFSK